MDGRTVLAAAGSAAFALARVRSISSALTCGLQKRTALFYGYSTDWKVEDGTSFAELVANYQTTGWNVEVWKDGGDERLLDQYLSDATVLIGGRGRVEEVLWYSILTMFWSFLTIPLGFPLFSSCSGCQICV